MSAGLYKRQMAWKQFIDKRSDKQRRAIVDHDCRRPTPDLHNDNDLTGRQERRTQSFRTNSSSTTPASRRTDKAASIVHSKAFAPSCLGGGTGERQQHRHNRQHQKDWDASSYPAPSYSSMLAARRRTVAAVAASSPESARSKPGSCTPRKTEDLRVALLHYAGSSSSSDRAGTAASLQAPSRARATSAPRGRSTPQKAAAPKATSSTAPASVAAAPSAVVAPPPLPRAQTQRVARPESSCGGGGGSGGEGSGENHTSAKNTSTLAKARPAGAAAAPAVVANRRRLMQGSEPLLQRGASDQASGLSSRGLASRGRDRGRRACGGMVVPSAGAAGGAEGISEDSDDEGAGGDERVVAKTTSAAMLAMDLVLKKQAWQRERAQLMTVIKLQQRQLARSSSSSCRRTHASTLGDSDGTATTAATITLTEPTSPRSAFCGSGATPPPPPMPTPQPLYFQRPPPPPQAPLARATSATEEARAAPGPLPAYDTGENGAGGPMAPCACGGVADALSTSSPPGNEEADKHGGQREQDRVFVFSSSERTRLLCKVELQREEAARFGRIPVDRGRERTEAAEAVFGGAAKVKRVVKSRRNSASSCPDSIVMAAAAGAETTAPSRHHPAINGGMGGGGGSGNSGSCCGHSEFGGDAVAASPPRRCSVEGRLEAMERSVEAVLRRLSELEGKQEKQRKQKQRGDDERPIDAADAAA